MKEKLLIYLTDEKVILFNEACEKLLTLKNNFETIQGELQAYLTKNLKSSISLLIDRSQEEINEEKLPRLFLWDRLRFLLYKKAEWKKLGGCGGFHFFRQGEESYLRWIHVSSQDPLFIWLSWLKSLPHLRKHVYFVQLEAIQFIKKHLPSLNGYQALLYSHFSSQTRHLIFKSNRFLLSRASLTNEDLNWSLNYLSRSYEDIFDNLKILNLVKGIDLKFSNIHTLPDRKAFLYFLSKLKKPSFKLNFGLHTKAWIGLGGYTLSILVVLLTLGLTYQAYQYKKESRIFLKNISVLKLKKSQLNNELKDKHDLPFRQVLEEYQWLKAYKKNPIKTMDTLSHFVEDENIKLVNFMWYHGKKVELTFKFLIEGKTGEILSNKFKECLRSLKKLFPKSTIQILETPLHSGPQETFENSCDPSLAFSQIKIIFP